MIRPSTLTTASSRTLAPVVRRCIVLLPLLATILGGPARAAPDEDGYGKSQGYPIGTTTTWGRQQYLVGALSKFDTLFEARPVPASPRPRPLTRADRAPDVWYTFNNERRNLQRYLDGNPTTGLLIVKDGRILVETYQYDRTEHHRFTSFSMAKTITAMLLGIALRDGAIRSLDDRADTYVPEFRGTAYGETPIRHLLTMSSGVAFTEDYDGKDDITRLWRATLLRTGPGGPVAVTQFNSRSRPPGEKFHYASAETQVLGMVLRGATHMPLCDISATRLPAADGRRGRRDLEHRCRRPGSHLLLFQRDPARLRAARPAAGVRRHPRRTTDRAAGLGACGNSL
ncbi:MAG: serine hydrolase [Alphaproteobacteria bacterium]|nr:serine hydrolase [Alphaproteobacteria bacterium]